MRYLPVLLLFLAAAVSAGESSAIDDYRSGKEAQERLEYFEAIEYFQSALKKNPSYIDALYSLAESYYLIDQFEQALAYAVQAEILNGKSIPIRTLKGRVLLGLGRFDEAVAIFQDILKAQPYNLDAQFGIGEIYMLAGSYSQAAEIYNKALLISPNNRKALLSLILLYDQMDDKEKAGSIVRQALDIYSGHPAVRYIAGKHYTLTGDYAEAEYQLKTALALDQAYLEAAYVLGRIMIEQHRYDDAAELLGRQRANARIDYLYWYLFGLAAFETENFSDGAGYLEKALAMRPDDELSRLLLEKNLLAFSGSAVPAEFLREAVDFHAAKADGYSEQNFLDIALFEYERALKFEPGYDKARQGLAEILKKKDLIWSYLLYLKGMGNGTTQSPDITDEIEIYESLLSGNRLYEWNVKNGGAAPDRLTYAVFALDDDSSLIHAGIAPIWHEYFLSAFKSYDPMEIVTGSGPVSGYADAFKKARTIGTDYFIVNSYFDSDRICSIMTEIYATASGTLLYSRESTKTGNDRILMATLTCIADLRNAVPLIGSIAGFLNDKAVVNLGKYNGIRAGDELAVFRAEDIGLSRTSLSVDYDLTKRLGMIKIELVDDFISLGSLTTDLFFNFMNIGDRVLPIGVQTVVQDREKRFLNNQLYRDLMNIR